MLQDLEEAASALSRSIETGRKDKSQLLVDIVETEKQVRTCIVSSGHFPFPPSALCFGCMHGAQKVVEGEKVCWSTTTTFIFLVARRKGCYTAVSMCSDTTSLEGKADS